jgi:hypothetical protein
MRSYGFKKVLKLSLLIKRFKYLNAPSAKRKPQISPISDTISAKSKLMVKQRMNNHLSLRILMKVKKI